MCVFNVCLTNCVVFLKKSSTYKMIIETNNNIRTVKEESSGVKLTRFQIEGWLELIRMLSHTAYSWNNKCQKCAGMGLNGFIFRKINKKYNTKEKKKSWEPFRICLLNSTANPAQFGWKWAGLAMLLIRQLLNSSQDFFL